MNLFPRSTSLVLLAAALAAQSPTTTAAPAGPPLIAKTSTRTYAMALQYAFGGATAQPAEPAEKGKHHVLTVDDTGKLTVTSGEGDVPGLDLDARPVVLMRIFDKQIQRAKMQAEAAMKLGGSERAGLDAGPIIAGMFAFPSQVERLRIQANGNPMKKDQGLMLSIDLQPVADSPFAKTAGLLEANPAGAPVLGNADLTMRFAVGRDGSKKLFEAMVPLISSFGMKPSDELTAMMAEMMALYDGCGGAQFGLDGSGMSMAIGVTDGPKAQTLMGSERYRNVMKAAYADSPILEEDPKFATSEHRGVGITEVSMEFGDEMAHNPFFGGSSSATTFTAVAGNLMLNSMRKDATGIRGLIDAVMEKKVASSPLPDGALLTMDLALAKVAQMFAGPQAAAAPEHFGLALLRSGPGLVVKIKVQ